MAREVGSECTELIRNTHMRTRLQSIYHTVGSWRATPGMVVVTMPRGSSNLVLALSAARHGCGCRYYSDPVLTLIILAIIAKSAIPLVRHCSHILLQGTPQNMLTSDVQVRPRRVAVLGQ